jgi:hypothetical protein
VLRPAFTILVLLASIMACSSREVSVAEASSCADAPVLEDWTPPYRERLAIEFSARSCAYTNAGSTEDCEWPRISVKARIADRSSPWVVAAWDEAQQHVEDGRLVTSQAGAVTIEGYATYEVWRRGDRARFWLVQEAGPGSGWCWMESAAIAEGFCEFLLFDARHGVSLQIRLPADLVSELPRIVADIEPVIAHVARYC